MEHVISYYSYCCTRWANAPIGPDTDKWARRLEYLDLMFKGFFKKDPHFAKLSDIGLSSTCLESWASKPENY